MTAHPEPPVLDAIHVPSLDIGGPMWRHTTTERCQNGLGLMRAEQPHYFGAGVTDED